MNFAQENANCLTTFFHSVIVMMVIPLHDDCYFSDVDVDAYVFISLSSDRRSIWNFLEQLTICKSRGPGNLTPRLFKYCETSISSPLCTFLTTKKSMSRESLGLQSILISPKMAEQIFPEPAFFSSKLGTLPPNTALDPERKRERFPYLKMKYRATTHRCRSDGMIF